MDSFTWALSLLKFRPDKPKSARPKPHLTLVKAPTRGEETKE